MTFQQPAAPELVQTDEFFVMGLETVVSKSANVFGEARLAALWQAFLSPEMEARIANRTNDNEYLTIFSDYVLDPKLSTFGDYAVGAYYEVPVTEEVPEGLTAMSVPAGNYLVFQSKGEGPTAGAQAWQEIDAYFEKNRDYRRAFTFDFEVHRKDAPDEVRIFVSVLDAFGR